MAGQSISNSNTSHPIRDQGEVENKMDFSPISELRVWSCQRCRCPRVSKPNAKGSRPFSFSGSSQCTGATTGWTARYVDVMCGKWGREFMSTMPSILHSGSHTGCAQRHISSTHVNEMI